MASQKGLGKGLGALFGESAEVQQEPLRLPIQKIEPNPDQPRKRFDPEELQALADYLRPFTCIDRVELLPFHQMGRYKWDAQGLDYPLKDHRTPTDAEMDAARLIFRRAGLRVQ